MSIHSPKRVTLSGDFVFLAAEYFERKSAGLDPEWVIIVEAERIGLALNNRAKTPEWEPDGEVVPCRLVVR